MIQLTLFDPIQIPLTRGLFALIDPTDADLGETRWFAGVYTKYGAYAAQMTNDGCRKMVYLHRKIVERMIGRSLGRREHVDHVDGNTLNNTRANLRIATPTQSHWNSRKRSNNTSGYKGVSWDKRAKVWAATFKINGRCIHLGCFDTPGKAHAAYCEAARKYAGEFARVE